MLYKFNNLKKLKVAIAKFHTKNPTGAVHKFETEDWLSAREKFEELLASSKSLFGEKNLIILRGVEELTEVEKKEIEKSETIVLWFRPEIEKSAEFNFFALSNALATGDRATLWLGYQRALATGATPEEIFWRSLWWQVRKLRDGSLSARLIRLWHDTKRSEGRDFGLELERFCCNI